MGIPLSNFIKLYNKMSTFCVINFYINKVYFKISSNTSPS